MADRSVSTAEVLEHASRKHRSLNLDQFLNVWNNLGKMMDEKLSEQKGVVLDKFGTFSLDKCMQPIFVLHADFASAYRLRQQRSPALNGGISTTRVNFSKLATLSGTTRDITRQIVDEVLLSLGTAIRKRGAVNLSFNPIGEFSCNQSVCLVRWDSDLLQRQKARNPSAGNRSINPASSARERASNSRTTSVLGSFGRKLEEHAEASSTSTPAGGFHGQGSRDRPPPSRNGINQGAPARSGYGQDGARNGSRDGAGKLNTGGNGNGHGNGHGGQPRERRRVTHARTPNAAGAPSPTTAEDVGRHFRDGIVERLRAKVGGWVTGDG